MTNSTLKFKTVVKDRLFYNRYKYCFGFCLAEASALRGPAITHEIIDSRLDQRIKWREISKQRWQTSVLVGYNEITDEIRQDLHTTHDLIAESNVDCKLIVSSHAGWLYTNDANFINHLQQFRYFFNKTYTEAVVNRPKDTILLKRSQYQHRSYLINVKITSAEKELLKNFFTNQSEHVRTSPSFNEWLYKGPFYRTQDYFFIDYSGEQWLTMLSLIRPGLIRKTLTIITK